MANSTHRSRTKVFDVELDAASTIIDIVVLELGVSFGLISFIEYNNPSIKVEFRQKTPKIVRQVARRHRGPYFLISWSDRVIVRCSISVRQLTERNVIHKIRFPAWSPAPETPKLSVGSNLCGVVCMR
jgi:hypothetical protein